MHAGYLYAIVICVFLPSHSTTSLKASDDKPQALEKYTSLYDLPPKKIKGLNPLFPPSDLKKLIGDTTQQLNSTTYPKWGVNGPCTDDHQIVPALYLLKALIAFSPHQKEFYILDIGAGNGSWMHILREEMQKQGISPDIRFHIIGVTGENYNHGNSGKVEIHGAITTYFYDCFKIEDLICSFVEKKKRGEILFDMENKVDLIVSGYTGVHLHFPVGMFWNAYHLLRPGKGLMSMHGFPVLFEENLDDIENKDYQDLGVYDSNMAKFLSMTQAPFLINSNTEGIIAPFLLKRPDIKLLELPLAYASTKLIRPKHATLKHVAYHKALEPLKRSITWSKDLTIDRSPQTISLQGAGYEFSEWLWKSIPYWQDLDLVWHPIIGTKEEVSNARRPQHDIPILQEEKRKQDDKS
jgi:SAM-dependent methyltransferase